MEDYRYIAWQQRNKPWMDGQKLLSSSQRTIVKLALSANPANQDVYETVQEFNSDGSFISCPIYADLDGETALNDCRKLSSKLCERYGDYPEIFFSGRKGFHLIVDYPIKYTKAHAVVERLMDTCGSYKSLDKKVYTSRRLLRVPNTVHTKTNLYKIAITPEELEFCDLDQIKGFAKNPHPLIAAREYDVDAIEEDVEAITVEIENEKAKVPSHELTGTWKDNITPCIWTIIEERPVDGTWNAVITVLARFFNSQQVSMDESLEIMFRHAHWREDDRHVRSVFRSVFRNASVFGCRQTALLEQHCDIWCRFNRETIWPTSSCGQD